MKFKIFGFEIQLGGNKATQSGGNFVRGKFDAAQTNHMNQRHWANADSLSADAANNPTVRKTLRDRARYEIANNSYFSIVEKFANEVIGSGPRMQFVDQDPLIAEQVENAWKMWFEDIEGEDLARLMFQAAAGDGESFCTEVNAKNENSPVNIMYVQVDPERCTNSFGFSGVLTPTNIDGIEIDSITQRPISYEFLRDHPGSSLLESLGDSRSFTLPAKMVIHYFRKMRAEQHRGIPEITSALPLGSKMRSFTLSTLEAARIASTFSGVLHTAGTDGFADADTTGGIQSQSTGEFDAFDAVALDNGTFLTLPEGWDMRQVSAEHPTTTYKEFKRELISEMSQSLNMPYNVAAMNSEGFNFSSGRLDRLSWRVVLKIRQKEFTRKVMKRLFMAWWREAVLIEGHLPNKVRRAGFTPVIKWFYDGDAAIDPEKESKGDKIDLEIRTENLATIYARKGKDWKTELTQIAEEQEFMRKLGITFDSFMPDDEPTNNETEEQEETENA